jgi:hypothetical protein
MKAWNCKHCHATNVSLHCGCGPDRAERGIVQESFAASMERLNSIELDLTPKTTRRKRLTDRRI